MEVPYLSSLPEALTRRGTEVTVTAEPAENYEFDHWSGDLSGTSKTKTITVSSDMNFTAHFAERGEAGVCL